MFAPIKAKRDARQSQSIKLRRAKAIRKFPTPESCRAPPNDCAGGADLKIEYNEDLQIREIISSDYDGDRKSDQAVYRDGTWRILRSSAGIVTTQFGVIGDMPVANRYLP